MSDAQRPAAGGEQGLLGYLVVEADSPDGSFAYVAYDDVVYRTKAEAWATVTDEGGRWLVEPADYGLPLMPAHFPPSARPLHTTPWVDPR